ncbi:hypothetical protein LMG29542_08056 [Paraburkholderia humisilvae]|uniref:Uncharacterized protein n=1 Tax=Paraburkholderia humisilvae TaxID=627669 RepID=A0A6J5F700_9BURK|nr:hypothetical protein LMG29542_08056 [Paraburkholderia humisilvae]
MIKKTSPTPGSKRLAGLPATVLAGLLYLVRPDMPLTRSWKEASGRPSNGMEPSFRTPGGYPLEHAAPMAPA